MLTICTPPHLWLSELLRKRRSSDQSHADISRRLFGPSGTFVSIRNQAEKVSGVNELLHINKDLQASAQNPRALLQGLRPGFLPENARLPLARDPRQPPRYAQHRDRVACAVPGSDKHISPSLAGPLLILLQDSLAQLGAIRDEIRGGFNPLTPGCAPRQPPTHHIQTTLCLLSLRPGRCREQDRGSMIKTDFQCSLRPAGPWRSES